MPIEQKAKPTNRSTAESPADALRAYGLTFPGAHLKSPWPNHLDLAVNDKTFAYLSPPGEPFAISCRLPDSHKAALRLPYTSPTGYGLGKWGWVSASIPKGKVDLEMLKAWLEESYRTQAPKRLVKELDAETGAAKSAPPKKRTAPQKRTATPKKKTVKKASATKSATNAKSATSAKKTTRAKKKATAKTTPARTRRRSR